MADKRVCPACHLTPLSRYDPDPLCAQRGPALYDALTASLVA